MAFARLGLDDLLELGHLGLVVLRVLLFAITVDSTTLDVTLDVTLDATYRSTFSDFKKQKRFVDYNLRNAFEVCSI
jgi:hypothetical protein